MELLPIDITLRVGRPEKVHATVRPFVAVSSFIWVYKGLYALS